MLQEKETPEEFTARIATFSTPELSDLSTELFFAYSHASAEDKALIPDQYNEVVGLYNKKTGRKDLLTFEKAMSAINGEEAKLYVEDGAKVPKNSTPKTTSPSNAAAPDIAATIPGYEEMNTCNKIISLSKKGLSNKEIIDLGFNKSTVNRQVGEYKKKLKNGK